MTLYILIPLKVEKTANWWKNRGEKRGEEFRLKLKTPEESLWSKLAGRESEDARFPYSSNLVL